MNRAPPQLTPDRFRRRSAAICAAGLLGLGLLFLANPATAGWFPPCLFHALTGLDCPGCGSLRAIHCLLNLQWAQALAYNPLTCLCLPFIGAWWLWHAARAAAGRAPAVPFIRPALLWVIVALMIGFGVIRNIPAGNDGAPAAAQADFNRAPRSATAGPQAGGPSRGPCRPGNPRRTEPATSARRLPG